MLDNWLLDSVARVSVAGTPLDASFTVTLELTPDGRVGPVALERDLQPTPLSSAVMDAFRKAVKPPLPRDFDRKMILADVSLAAATFVSASTSRQRLSPEALSCFSPSTSKRRVKVVIESANDADGRVKDIHVGLPKGFEAAVSCIRDLRKNVLGKKLEPLNVEEEIEVGPMRVVAYRRLEGSLEPAAIKQVIQGAKDQIRTCYEKALTKNPKLAGAVKTKFTINADGTVNDSRVVMSDVADVAVGTCIVSVLDGLTFPKPKGGGVVVVNYPFVFKSPG